MESKILDWEAPKALLEYSASSGQRFFEIIMVMLIFVYGRIPVELYQVIINRSDLIPDWKSFFGQFKDCIDSGMVRLSFLFQIRKCLGKACNGNWSKMSSYISPFHFSHLLERFLYLVSSVKNIFFTTKSCLLETLVCENWKLNSKSVSETDTSLKAELYSLEGILVGLGHDILTREKGALEWLEKTDTAAKKNYPSLVSRLFIHVCLVCSNAADYFDVLFGLLQKDEISSLLPLEFRKLLDVPRPPKDPYEREYKDPYEREYKENPLVIMYLGNNRPTFPCPDAIFVDMGLIHCKEDAFDMLYLRRIECIQQDAILDLETGHVGDENVPSCNIECGHLSDLQRGYQVVWRCEHKFGASLNPFALK
ncbi:hypothetical protein MKW94_007047, partial [Papaver nudicaule]|nr:hypothetical protein [Papaver nudicaule]